MKECLDEWVKQFYDDIGFQPGICGIKGFELYTCKFKDCKTTIDGKNLLNHYLSVHHHPKDRSFDAGEFTKNYMKYLSGSIKYRV